MSKRPVLWAIVAVTALLAVALLILFYVQLDQSKPGEIAVALGGIIGGIIGAGGAVLAVFLMLWRQRAEDAAKVADAVSTEVATLARYVIATIEICTHIAGGANAMLRKDAGSITKSLGDPIIYPAVADRVALLPHPSATTEFYMRLSEAKSMTEMLRAASPPPVSAIYTTAPPEYITRENVEVLADSLITALQLAKNILEDNPAPLAAAVRGEVLGQIDECLLSARQSFPNAESFRGRN